MSRAVDNPIINSSFAEPTRYWDYKEGPPVLMDNRRPAGCYLRARTRGAQRAMFEEEFVPLETVNTIRERVKAWREKGYPGVTPLTRQLLNHWNNPERERKLFFCQREAAARRWVRAVNHHGEFGQWVFVVCKDPHALRNILRAHV